MRWNSIYINYSEINYNDIINHDCSLGWQQVSGGAGDHGREDGPTGPADERDQQRDEGDQDVHLGEGLHSAGWAGQKVSFPLIAAILREICSESIWTTKSMLEFGRGEWKQFSHLPLRHPLSGITSTLNWLSCGISLQRGWCGPWFECQNSHFLFFHHVTIYIHNWFTEVLVSSFEHSNTYRDEVDVIRRAFYYRSFNFSFFFTAARFTLLCTLLVYGLTGEVKTLCQNLSGLQPPPPLSTS